MDNNTITSIEGVLYIHRELWRVVEIRMETATQIKKGAFYDHLVAMLFAFHTLEAYLNYVGEFLAPNIWKDERNYFRKEPFRGFDGKVRKVLELAGIKEPDRMAPPYSTVWFVKTFRDLIVHSKPERFNHVEVHTIEEEPDLYNTPFCNMVTPVNAMRVKKDIASFIEEIHVAARTKINDIRFGPSALQGPFQLSSGITRLLK